MVFLKQYLAKLTCKNVRTQIENSFRGTFHHYKEIWIAFFGFLGVSVHRVLVLVHRTERLLCYFGKSIAELFHRWRDRLHEAKNGGFRSIAGAFSFHDIGLSSSKDCTRAQLGASTNIHIECI